MSTRDFLTTCAAVRTIVHDAFGHRVAWLNAGGSLVHGRGHEGSDLDLGVILDTYHDDDLVAMRRVVAELQAVHPLVALSFGYADEISSHAAYVQDGANGCMALCYLASAYTLSGRNLYLDLIAAVPEAEFRRSVIQTLERYLHDLHNVYFASPADTPELERYARKYLARAAIDVLLYYRITDMSPYDHLSSSEVLERFRSNPLLGGHLADITPESPPAAMLGAFRNLLLMLKRDYGIL